MAICLKCKKVVRSKDHQVIISTLNRPTKPDDHQHFHFACWVQFFNDSVNNRTRAEVEKMRIMAMGIMNNPMIKNVLDKVGGSEQLQAMLGKPLIPNDIIIAKGVEKRVEKSVIAKKIDDGRKKREKGKRRR